MFKSCLGAALLLANGVHADFTLVPLADVGWRINLVDRVFDGQFTMFNYELTITAQEKDLSHFVLEVQCGEEVTGPTNFVGGGIAYDPTTKKTGIKWDEEVAKGTTTLYTLYLDGDVAAAPGGIGYAVKGGTYYAYGTVGGPDCNTPTTSGTGGGEKDEKDEDGEKGASLSKSFCSGPLTALCTRNKYTKAYTMVYPSPRDTSIPCGWDLTGARLTLDFHQNSLLVEVSCSGWCGDVDDDANPDGKSADGTFPIEETWTDAAALGGNEGMVCLLDLNNDSTADVAVGVLGGAAKLAAYGSGEANTAGAFGAEITGASVIAKLPGSDTSLFSRGLTLEIGGVKGLPGFSGPIIGVQCYAGTSHGSTTHADWLPSTTAFSLPPACPEECERTDSPEGVFECCPHPPDWTMTCTCCGSSSDAVQFASLLEGLQGLRG